MQSANEVIGRARDAERRLWQHFGLTPDERYVEVAGLRVRVLELGNPSGTPLMFVQGGLGEAFQYAELLAQLKDFRCVALDRPGGGLSDGVNFLEVDVRKLAVDVLRAVLDAVGLQQTSVVANSMGGWWTFQLALSSPERVARMVMLGCPAVLLNTSAPLSMRLVSVPVLGRGVVALMKPASPDKAREVPSFLGHPRSVGQRWSEVEAETYYRFAELPNFRQSWLTLLQRFLRPWGSNSEMRIAESELRRVAHPTLFLWGKQDPFGTLQAAHSALAVMPHARLEIVGTGHLPWWDEPEQCAQLTRQFLGSVD
jgi:pimeloyl-ACP methyl ester carboxylesterase